MGSQTIDTQLEAFFKGNRGRKNINLKETVSQQKHSADEPQMFAYPHFAICYASANIKALETLGYAEHICNYLVI